MSGDNLAVVPFTKDADGDDGGTPGPFQATIDVAENGFVLNVTGTENDDTTMVFLYDAKGDNGPVGLIETLIRKLGVADKVKIQR